MKEKIYKMPWNFSVVNWLKLSLNPNIMIEKPAKKNLYDKRIFIEWMFIV